MNRNLFIVASSVVLVAVLAAPRTASGQVSRLTTGFQSDASRYVWSAGLDLVRRGDHWSFTLYNRFRSEAFLLSRQVNEFRDENEASARLTRRLTATVDAVGMGEGSWFSQNSSSTVEGYGGLRFTPRPFFMFEPAVGAVVDRKPGLLLEGQVEPDVLVDTGPGVSLRAALTDIDVGGFDIGAATTNRWHFISPRFGRDLRARADATKQFDDGLLRIDLRFGDLVRESYQASSLLNRLENAQRADDTIEATQSDTLDAGLEFEYPLSSSWRFLTTANLVFNRRYVRTLRAPEEELFFDTNFDRQVGQLNAILSRDTRNSTLRLTASRSVTSERRRLDNADDLPPGQAAQKSLTLRLADFDRSVFSLQAMGNQNVNRWLAVRSSFGASILRHDTPVANLDDRDESAFDAQVGLIFFLSKTLEADLRAFAVEHHTVYLDGSRSGENHKRRSLRFLPGMRWRPDGKTDLRFETEVRAVYTTDDFDIPDQPRNDQSARELKYGGTFSRQLGGGAALWFDASYSKLLLGRLLWEDFEEIPFDTLSTTTGWLRLEVGRKWRAEFGVRVFNRNEYERSLTVRYSPPGAGDVIQTITRGGRRLLVQVGPTGAFSIPLSKNSEIRMAGWVQFQQTRITLYGELPPDDQEAIQEAARNSERRTIPNLTISVLWNV